MSWHEYMEAVRVRDSDPPFYSLIMAAMWGADSTNAARLRNAFPDVWDELQRRYNAPAGVLDGEPRPAEWALEKYGLA